MLKKRIFDGRTACMLLLCCSSVFIYPGCRKPEPDKLIVEKMETMDAEAPVTIKFSEIYQKLPQTIVYAAAAKLNFYTGRAEWIRTETNLTVRIPLDNTNTDFVYAVKEFNNPGETNVYIVTLELEDGATENDFTGKKLWLDLQDWTYYAIQYEHNTAIKGIVPVVLSKSGWEQCMLDAGSFSLNGNMELVVITGDQDCPNNPNESGGGGFWQNMKEFFEGVGEALGSHGPKDGVGSGTPFVGPMNSPFNNGPGMPLLGGLGGGNVNWNPTSNTGGIFVIDEVENNGIVTPNNNAVVNYVKNVLHLNVARADYISMHPDVASEIMNYLIAPVSLVGVSNTQRNANCVEHIDAMNFMPAYFNEINTYTGGGGHWWDKGGDGYMFNKKKLLEFTLQSKPYTMIDCGALNSLPMTMLQEVGSYQVPQVVLNRIDSIRSANSSAGYNTQTFNIQGILSAADNVVNCDYFPVKINQLPQINGVTWTPTQLLEYFRLHLTYFALPVGTVFEPYYHVSYTGANINDSAKFLSPYTTSLGALVSIGIVPDEGTVVESEYITSSSTNHFRFMFSTMISPIDGGHPVSGNRRFGIFPDGATGYCFYTMGVDRVSNPLTATANWITGLGFAAADELWTTVQQRMIYFINLYGGSASFYSPTSRKARPDWQQIRRYLMGEITLREYKDLLNCP
jgi:hypothetical protein